MNIGGCFLGGLAALALVVGCSRATLQQRAEARVANAEAAMDACKKGLGLGGVPTPSNMALYDATTGPTAQDPAQVRIKAFCGSELDELLEARRTLNDLRQ